MENRNLPWEFVVQMLRQFPTLNPNPPGFEPTPDPTAAESLADAPVGGMIDKTRTAIQERRRLLEEAGR